MKRLLCLFLIVAMLLSIGVIFAACDKPIDLLQKEENNQKIEYEYSTESNRVTLNMRDATVDEKAIYDASDVTLIITNVRRSENGVIFYLEAKNNSNAFREIKGDNYVVNGVSMIQGSFSRKLDAYESSKIEFYLDAALLEMMGVKTIGQLDISVSVLDQDGNVLDENAVATITTSEYGYVHTHSFKGDVLFDEAGVLIVLLEISLGGSDDTGMFLYFLNNTDKTLDVAFKNVTINGWTIAVNDLQATLFPGLHTVEFIDLRYREDIGLRKPNDIQNVYYDVTVKDQQGAVVFDKTRLGYFPGNAEYVENIEIAGQTLYEDDDLQVVHTDTILSGNFPSFEFYFKNASDRTRTVVIEDFKINDVEHSGSINRLLYAGVQYKQYLSLYSSDRVSGKDPWTVTAVLRVYDEQNNIIKEAPISFTVDK